MYKSDKEIDKVYEEFKKLQDGFDWCKYNEKDAFRTAVKRILSKEN